MKGKNKKQIIKKMKFKIVYVFKKICVSGQRKDVLKPLIIKM